MKPTLHAASAWLALAWVASARLALAAPATSDDIRDIRGPVVIPPWWRWPAAVAASVLATIIVAALVRRWRKRRHSPLSPLDRARAAFVLAEVHARAGRAHEWADVVAEALRNALAVRLGADVLPQTTAELAASPWAQPLRPEDLAQPNVTSKIVEAPTVIGLLETCDLARFAMATVDADALLAKTDVAREFVERLFAPPKPHAPPLLSTPVTS